VRTGGHEMVLSKEQIQRFWDKVDVRGPDQCWPWLGATDRRGYGQISFNGRNYRAPRLAILLHTGEMPGQGQDACHTCDNPACVSPFHLWSCTRRENMQDAGRKGRIKSWKQKLTPSQVRDIRKDPRPQKDIAADYGLHFATISKIKSGKVWKHLLVTE